MLKVVQWWGKNVGLKFNCAKLHNQTQVQFFFPSHPSSSSGTTRCLQPTKKRGKRKWKRKKLTPIAIRVLLDHHRTFLNAKCCLVMAKNRKTQATTQVFLGHHQTTFNVERCRKNQTFKLQFCRKFCVVKFKLIFFWLKKSELKLESSKVLSTKKKTRKKEEEKNLSCNLGLKLDLSYNLGFLGHHQTNLDTEGCLAMAENIKNPSYNSIFFFHRQTTRWKNKTWVTTRVLMLLK